MFDRIRNFTGEFYFDGVRVPIPVNSYLFQRKTSYAVQMFQLFAYLVHETNFFEKYTKLYITTRMSYSDLQKLTGAPISTIRSTVARDRSKCISKFGNCELAVDEYIETPSITKDEFGDKVYSGGTKSSLSLIEQQELQAVVMRIKAYLISVGVSTDAPKEGLIEGFKKEKVKIISEYEDKITALNNVLIKATNPDSSEIEQLREKVKQQKGLEDKIKALTDELNEVKNTAITEDKYYKNISLFLSNPVERKGGKAFNPSSASQLADKLTKYVKQKVEIKSLLSKYSGNDIDALDRFLGGEKIPDEEFTREVTNIVSYAWKGL